MANSIVIELLGIFFQPWHALMLDYREAPEVMILLKNFELLSPFASLSFVKAHYLSIRSVRPLRETSSSAYHSVSQIVVYSLIRT